MSALRNRVARLEAKAERSILLALPGIWRVGDHGNTWSEAAQHLGYRKPYPLPMATVLPDGTELDAEDLRAAGLL